MTEEKTKRIDTQMSVDARILRDRLRALDVGDRVGYAELSEAIGRNVQTIARGALATARRALMREDRVVFGVERGEGLIRLNDGEIVEHGSTGLRRIRRAAQRTAKLVTCAEFDRLSPEERSRHNMTLSLTGALQIMTSSHSQKKIEQAVSAANEAIPLAKTLEMFQK